MKKDEIPQLEEQLAYLATVKDEDIDFSDIPEITDFSNAIRGGMFKPLKRHITLRIDADIIAWFKKYHPKYQTAINNALREYIKTHTQSA